MLSSKFFTVSKCKSTLSNNNLFNSGTKKLFLYKRAFSYTKYTMSSKLTNGSIVNNCPKRYFSAGSDDKANENAEEGKRSKLMPFLMFTAVASFGLYWLSESDVHVPTDCTGKKNMPKFKTKDVLDRAQLRNAFD